MSKYDNLDTVFVGKVGRLEILDGFSKSLGLIAPDSLECKSDYPLPFTC